MWTAAVISSLVLFGGCGDDDATGPNPATTGLDPGNAEMLEDVTPPSGPDPEALPPPPKPVLDKVPARILPEGRPVQVSRSILTPTNGWLVSDGRRLTLVYAGSSGVDASVGRFYILRQSLLAGDQGLNIVDVPGQRALTITRAPQGARVETTSQRGNLVFRTASGREGTLHLASDKVTFP